jgi:hypothetical protein
VQTGIFSTIKEIYTEITQSSRTMTTSSNLLLLNVEDILGFAQLKAGRFNKIIKRFSIKRAVEEIV